MGEWVEILDIRGFGVLYERVVECEFGAVLGGREPGCLEAESLAAGKEGNWLMGGMGHGSRKGRDLAAGRDGT